MTCAHCGGELVDGAKFCPHCGERLWADAQPHDRLRVLLEQALGTHYRVVRELGRGGMGIVYLAHERGLDRDVAIKVLPPERALSEHYRERFLREARTAGKLSHPNIVPLYSFGEHEGMPYYVMGYVEGESLASRLDRENRLPEADVRRILIAVGEALHYAHQRGVVHRDIKPQNILLEAGSNRPMLTDFGIAKIDSGATAFTSTGVVIGTPDYMSPEQASGSPDIGPASDLFSLGIVGYAMLAGRVPMPTEGRTPAEVLAARITGRIAPPPIVGSEVSPSLVSTVMRCLEKDPARRFPDAGVFTSVLARREDDEEEVPSELEAIESIGLLNLSFAYVGTAAWLVWRNAASPHIALELAGKILPLLAILSMLLTLALAVAAQRRGHRLARIIHHIFRAPRSWRVWYPRRFRRHDDVWDRLPVGVRLVRASFGWFAAAAIIVPAHVVVWRLLHPEWGQSSGGGKNWWVTAAVTLPVLGVLLAPLISAWRVTESLKRKGLPQGDAGRFAYAAPLAQRSFWTRPAVAALLRPAAGAGRRQAPTLAETSTSTDRTRR